MIRKKIPERIFFVIFLAFVVTCAVVLSNDQQVVVEHPAKDTMSISA
jgi:hypothetical protein